MREYTQKEIKILKANPYTFKVTKNKLYFTAEFKEKFWTGYKAGVAPRKLLEDFGYDLSMFGQKQIDSITQRVKAQALRPEGFGEGENHDRRPSMPNNVPKLTPEATVTLWNEVKYLRQEVEFLKKLLSGKEKR